MENKLPKSLPDNWRTKLSYDVMRLALYTKRGLFAIRNAASHIADQKDLKYRGFTFTKDFLYPLYSNNFDYQRGEKLFNVYEHFRKNKEQFNNLLMLMHNKRRVDDFLDSWYDSKRNAIFALMQHPGWQPNNFALKVDASSVNSLDFKLGTELFVQAMKLYRWSNTRGLKVVDRYDAVGFHPNHNTDHNLNEFKNLFLELYRFFVLDDVKIPSNRDGIYNFNYSQVQGDVVSYKSNQFVNDHLEKYPVNVKVDDRYVDKFQETFGVKFKDFFPTFTKRMFVSHAYADGIDDSNDQWLAFVLLKLSEPDNLGLFMSGLYSYLQLNKPIPKLTVVKKLMSISKALIPYHNARNFISTSYNGVSFVAIEENFDRIFNEYIDKWYEDYASFSLSVQVKIRLPEGGFTWSHHPNYNQLVAKLFDCFVSTTLDDSLLINLHPVAQILSSYSHRWTSCHNVVDTQINGETPVNYSIGSYSRGVWQMAQAGGFVITKPESFVDDEQCFVPLVYRAQMFVDPELTVIRQHLPYPGRNRDDLAKNEAKTHRVILHKLFGAYNGHDSNSWLSVTSQDGDSVSLSGFNWERKRLGNTQHTLEEVMLSGSYLGYSGESTFSFSILNFPTPTNFTLPIGKRHYIFNLFEGNNDSTSGYESGFSYSADTSERLILPTTYLVDGVESKTLNGVITFDTGNFVSKPYVVHNGDTFQVLEHLPQGAGTCTKCKRSFFELATKDFCGACLKTSTSTSVATLIGSADPVYFKASSLDELKAFMLSLSTNRSDLVWRTNATLMSFVLDRNYILSLHNKKLSIKVTNVDPSKLVNVSDVVFE